MARRFAISDIHGCAATFRKLVLDILQLSNEDTLYLLGDYINKGPDSKAVLDYIFELRDAGFKVRCLRGNHEQYLLDALASPWDEEVFLSRGGKETLESFGVKSSREIPVKYLSFIQALPFYINLEKYLLIHAGLNFALVDPYTDTSAMLNIREMSVDLKKTGGRSIIHGHVPTPVEEIEKSVQLDFSHISIDAGCVYYHHPNMSNLVALDLDLGKLYIQPNID